MKLLLTIIDKSNIIKNNQCRQSTEKEGRKEYIKKDISSQEIKISKY